MRQTNRRMTVEDRGGAFRTEEVDSLLSNVGGASFAGVWRLRHGTHAAACAGACGVSLLVIAAVCAVGGRYHVASGENLDHARSLSSAMGDLLEIGRRAGVAVASGNNRNATSPEAPLRRALGGDGGQEFMGGKSSPSMGSSDNLFVAVAETIESEGKQMEALTDQYMVVYNGPVNVRLRKDMQSDVVRTKLKCQIVSGQKDADNWLKLNAENGYMKVEVEDQALLTGLRYKRIPRGRTQCSSIGMHAINNAQICQSAAAAFDSRHYFTIKEGSESRETGCFFLHGAVTWLAIDPTNSVDFPDREEICSSVPFCQPLPETTTSTTPVTTLTTTTHATTEMQRATAMTTSSRYAFPSLFCWLIMMVHGYERDLVKNQYKHSQSVFGCDEFLVYSEESVELSEEYSTQALGKMSSMDKSFGDWGSWANTAIFITAWNRIIEHGKFLQHDWVVKVDPDTVFHPDRLKLHLQAIPPGQSIYFQNCRGYPTIGALEIFSSMAVATYGKGYKDHCDELAHGSAEDFFICSCMLKLGVEKRRDLTLLRHQKPGGCENTWTVAFHPYKGVYNYTACARMR